MEVQENENALPLWAILLIILGALIWIVAVIGAYIKSISCMFQSNVSGSTGHKILLFILVLFFGPFWWILYAIDTDYCRKVVKITDISQK